MAIATTDSSHVGLFDSVTGLAFGPTFATDQHALDYLSWITKNGYARPLALSPLIHRHMYGLWFTQRCDQETGELLQLLLEDLAA